MAVLTHDDDDQEDELVQKSGRPPRADDKLTDHFRWGEFAAAGGPLPPPQRWTEYVRLATLYLEPLRRAFGVCTVHSGYRTPAHNREVGGAPRSVHMANWDPPAVAADVSFQSGTPREWYEAAQRLGPGGLGIYSTHIHVDSRRGPAARW